MSEKINLKDIYHIRPEIYNGSSCFKNKIAIATVSAHKILGDEGVSIIQNKLSVLDDIEDYGFGSIQRLIHLNTNKIFRVIDVSVERMIEDYNRRLKISRDKNLTPPDFTVPSKLKKNNYEKLKEIDNYVITVYGTYGKRKKQIGIPPKEYYQDNKY